MIFKREINEFCKINNVCVPLLLLLLLYILYQLDFKPQIQFPLHKYVLPQFDAAHH